MNPGLVRHERWPLLPDQGQPEATGAVARTLLDHCQVPGACQLDPPTRLRMQEPRNVPAPPAVTMPLLLDVAPDLAVAGQRLPPGAAAQQRPLGYDECATSYDHRLPAQHPVRREQSERDADGRGQIATGSPEARYDRKVVAQGARIAAPSQTLARTSRSAASAGCPGLRIGGTRG